MAAIAPEQAGGRNVVAFLDMLAGSEGTDTQSRVASHSRAITSKVLAPSSARAAAAAFFCWLGSTP